MTISSGDIDIRKRLFIIRGLPGAGKTTLAEMIGVLFPDTHIFAMDDYFTDAQGNYNFEPEKIKNAALWCQQQVENRMQAGDLVVTVHNTFTQGWEAEKYFELAQKYGYEPFIVEAQNQFGTDHGVSQQKHDKMMDRFQSSVEFNRLNHVDVQPKPAD